VTALNHLARGYPIDLMSGGQEIFVKQSECAVGIEGRAHVMELAPVGIELV